MTEQEKNMTPAEIITSLKTMSLSTSNLMFTRRTDNNHADFINGLKEVRNELKRISEKHHSFSHGSAYVALGEALDYIQYLKDVIGTVKDTIQISENRGNI